MIRAVFFACDSIVSPGGTPRAGARTFVRACANRFPLLAMTDHTYPGAANALRKADLASLFLDILAASEVERIKPAPDLLLAALGRIGFLLRDRNPIEPRECLVVESSPDGVEAARRAGMRCLAVAHSIPASSLTADFVRESFDSIDLDEILRVCAA